MYSIYREYVRTFTDITTGVSSQVSAKFIIFFSKLSFILNK
jgi:hypothetical protein